MPSSSDGWSDTSSESAKTSVPAYTVCGQDCWIKAGWDRPHRTLGAQPIPEHPPASEETMRQLAVSLYQPVHFWQFRVLKLDASKDVNAPLSCTLHVASMVLLEMVVLQAPGLELEYQALSYSWGRPQFFVSIQCNGLQVPITQHLAEALRHLRSGTDSYLFVDALCIHQHDLLEKGQQVQLMYTILSNLQATFEKTRDPQVIKLMEAADRDLVPGSLSKDLPSVYQKLYQKHRSLQECKALKDSISQAIYRLTTAVPWFTRCWDRQEIYAAQAVQFVCGVYRFDIKALRLHPLRHKSRCLDLVLFPPNYDKNYSREFQYLGTSLPPWVQTVFDNTEGFKASLYQDLIYALQNMAEGELRAQDRLLQTIDYTKSTSVVFQDWTKSIINAERQLWPLNVFEDRSSPGPSDLPSWVPDLRCKKYRVWVHVRPVVYSRPQYPNFKQDLQETGVLRLTGSKFGVCNPRPLPYLEYTELFTPVTDDLLRSWTRRITAPGIVEFCRPTDLKLPRSVPDPKADEYRYSDASKDRALYLLIVLKRLNYRLWDIADRSTYEGNDFGFQSFLVPAGVEAGDIVVACTGHTTDVILAYALRRQGDRYRFLGVCLSCCPDECVRPDYDIVIQRHLEEFCII